jgi:hypothetical protein
MSPRRALLVAGFVFQSFIFQIPTIAWPQLGLIFCPVTASASRLASHATA